MTTATASAPAAAAAAAASVTAASPCTAALHFSAPARCTVTQLLPVLNPSLTPWQWKVRLEGDQWTGESQFTTAPKQTTQFQLSFHCHAANQQCRGILVLRNRTTGDELTFSLTGDSTEPLLEPPTVLHTEARQWTAHSVTVANDCPALVEYQVESDLPSLSSAPTLRVPPQSSAVYPFSIRPLLAGDFPACLTFSAYYDGRPVQRCFPLHLQVRAPHPSSSLTLQCRAHSSITADLEVLNPSPIHPAEFAVEWTGADIDGPATLSVPPSSSATYPLTFAPLRPGIQSGSISFLHPEHGELAYSLVLQADEAETVQLQPVKVELGGSEDIAVWVQNVLQEDVTLNARLSNREAFDCKPSTLTLTAGGLGQVQLRYSPTRLHEPEDCDLVFSHPRAGEWRYHARGTGLAPLTPLPEVGFTGFVEQPVERIVQFRNPYTSPVSFKFALDPPSSPFSLSPPIGAQPASADSFVCTVPARSSVAVPVNFCAPVIQSFSASLLVTQANAPQTSICWHYPLIGLGEGLLVADVLMLQTKAKQSKSILHRIDLPAASLTSSSPLRADVEFDDGDARAGLQAVLEGAPRVEDGQVVVDVRLLWAPMKALSARCALVLSRDGGGRWRYPVQLVATAGDPDDTIELEAEVGRGQGATFHLHNAVDRGAGYRAYLSTSSSPFFSVAPKTGRLPPSSAAQGAALTVSFAPLEYGRFVYEGQLIVETEQTEFRFALKGSHPKRPVKRASTGR